MPKCVLFYGPLGIGKTFVANAAASIYDILIIYGAGCNFIVIYVGNRPKNMKEMFNLAKKADKAATFIYEMTLLASKICKRRSWMWS